MAFRTHLYFFGKVLFQGVRKIFGNADALNVANALDRHFGDFHTNVALMSTHLVLSVFASVLGLILEVSLVCFGCTGKPRDLD